MKSPESDRWPHSLTASHEESHTVDECTELSSVSCWLDAIPESCWTLAEQAKPSRRLLSRTHPDSYQLPEGCNVMAELLMNFFEGEKQEVTLFDSNHDWYPDLVWQDSTAFDISLIQSCKLSYISSTVIEIFPLKIVSGYNCNPCSLRRDTDIASRMLWECFCVIASEALA